MDILYDDQKTWDLICSGKTNGVFQCESYLVQGWLKKIKPRNTWELAAVVSLVRPGPLKSGYADLYASYKNKEKEIESFGDVRIDNILNSTYNLVVYQEALIQLGKRLAWQHLTEKEKLILADDLRKAVGKKNQQKILEIGHKFVEGCLHNNVTKELADKLFEVIKNCGRYAFNLSHAWKYAVVGYETAYLKAHHPLEFYATYLSYAEERLDQREEISRLTEEGKIFGIKFVGPNFNSKNLEFQIENNDTIRYGLRHIKYYQNTLSEKLNDIPVIDDWKKLLILLFSDTYGVKIRSNTAKALISCGAFSDVGIGRKALLSLYDFLSELTDKELNQVIERLHDCEDLDKLSELVLSIKTNKKRVEIIRSRLTFIKLDDYDNPSWVEEIEKRLLGIALSATALDNKNTDSYDKISDCTGNFADFTKRRVAVIIDEINLTVTKKGANPGQKMAKIFTHDESGRLDHLPVFPDLFAEKSDVLLQNNTVLLDIYYKNNGWIIKNISQI